jgi:hypothetical protein
MAVPFTDNQQGYIDGLNKARDAIAVVKNKFDGDARAREALDEVSRLLETVAYNLLQLAEGESVL